MTQAVESFLEKLEKGKICKDWDPKMGSSEIAYYAKETSEEDSE